MIKTIFHRSEQYEQRRKDIRKAAVGQVLSIARTVGCRLEDLLEFVPL